MTKVLLVNPSFHPHRREPEIPNTLEKAGSLEISTAMRVPPISLMCLASFLEQNDHSATILDARLYSADEFKEQLKRNLNAHSLIGLTVMTSQIPDALDVTDHIKDNDPDLPILWGGCHPTLFPQQTVADENVDFVIRGEGELPLLDLVNHLQKNRPRITEIGSLVYKNQDQVNMNPLHSEFLDINELPYPAYHLVDMNRYIEKRHISGRVIRCVEFPTSRGCPHRCGFCINTIIGRRTWRPMSVKKSTEIMDFVVQTWKTNHVHFLDDAFFPDRERSRRILHHILERGYDITWGATCRADYFDHFDQSFMELMQRSRCVQLRIGMESGSQRMLDYMHKDVTIEQILKAITLCEKYGIQPFVSYMIGVPTETREEIEMSLRLALKIRKMAPDAILLPLVFRPYPGGDLYEDCKKGGLREPESLRGWCTFQRVLTGYIDSLDWVTEKSFVRDAGFWMGVSQKERLYSRVKAESMGQRIRKMGLGFLACLANERWKHNFWRFPLDSRVALFLYTKGMIHQ